MFVCLAFYASLTALAPEYEACGVVKSPASFVATCEASDRCEVIVTRAGTIRLEYTTEAR